MASLISKLWARLCAKRDPLSIMIIGLDNSGKTSILNQLASLSHSGGVATQQFHSQASDLTNPVSSSHPQLQSTTSTQKEKLTSDNGQRNIMPTVGYNYERIQYKNLTITVLDFSGQSRYRNLWQEFYNGVDGIVFVIDSSDLIRFVVARDELETLLSHPYFSTLDLGDQFTMQTASSSSIAQKQLTISQGKLIQTPLDTSANIVTGSHRGSNKSVKRGVINRPTGRRRTKVPILFLANKSDLPNSVDTAAIVKALNLSQLSTQRHPWHIQATSVNLDQGITEALDWLADQLLTFSAVT